MKPQHWLITDGEAAQLMRQTTPGQKWQRGGNTQIHWTAGCGHHKPSDTQTSSSTPKDYKFNTKLQIPQHLGSQIKLEFLRYFTLKKWNLECLCYPLDKTWEHQLPTYHLPSQRSVVQICLSRLYFFLLGNGWDTDRLGIQSLTDSEDREDLSKTPKDLSAGSEFMKCLQKNPTDSFPTPYYQGHSVATVPSLKANFNWDSCQRFGPYKSPWSNSHLKYLRCRWIFFTLNPHPAH